MAATNERLEDRIKTGDFREDLYYRLSVIPVELPPLCNRLTDIPLLVKHFLKIIKEQEQREFTIEAPAIKALHCYQWPGNVRELENVISRAAALCEESNITIADLPDNIIELAQQVVTGEEEDVSKFRGQSLKAFLRSKERDYIQHVLDQCGGDKEKAAKSLGISLATFYRKIGEG